MLTKVKNRLSKKKPLKWCVPSLTIKLILLQGGHPRDSSQPVPQLGSRDGATGLQDCTSDSNGRWGKLHHITTFLTQLSFRHMAISFAPNYTLAYKTTEPPSQNISWNFPLKLLYTCTSLNSCSMKKKQWINFHCSILLPSILQAAFFPTNKGIALGFLKLYSCWHFSKALPCLW